MNIVRFKARFLSTVERGLVTPNQARDLIWAASSARADQAPALRDFMASTLRKNLDAFSPKAQRDLHQFINPPSVEPLPTGLEVGPNQPEKALKWGEQSAFAPSYGRARAGSISPNDPKQGAVGDCGTIASLIGLARKNKGFLRRMLTPRDDGTHDVTFHRKNADGTFTPETINIDRALPFWGSTTPKPRWAPFTPAMAGSRSPGKLWPSLLEKAFATWRGGYQNAESIWPHDILEMLTGQKARSTFCNADDFDADRLFDDMQRTLDKGGVVISSTNGRSTGDEGPPNLETGLFNAHAYTVMRVSGTGDQRTIMLRNTWPNVTRESTDGPFITMPYSTWLKSNGVVSFLDKLPVAR